MNTTYYDFTPTHEITITHHSDDDRRETFPVQLLDGAAYTEAEWDAATPADWELDEDGNWWFQGREAPDPSTTVSVREL